MDKSLSLLDHVTCLTTIKCQCGSEEITIEDSMEAIDFFYDRGWRVKKGLVKCPSCVNSVTIIVDGKKETVIRESGC